MTLHSSFLYPPPRLPPCALGRVPGNWSPHKPSIIHLHKLLYLALHA